MWYLSGHRSFRASSTSILNLFKCHCFLMKIFCVLLWEIFQSLGTLKLKPTHMYMCTLSWSVFWFSASVWLPPSQTLLFYCYLWMAKPPFLNWQWFHFFNSSWRKLLIIVRLLFFLPGLPTNHLIDELLKAKKSLLCRSIFLFNVLFTYCLNHMEWSTLILCCLSF